MGWLSKVIVDVECLTWIQTTDYREAEMEMGGGEGSYQYNDCSHWLYCVMFFVSVKCTTINAVFYNIFIWLFLISNAFHSTNSTYFFIMMFVSLLSLLKCLIGSRSAIFSVKDVGDWVWKVWQSRGWNGMHQRREKDVESPRTNDWRFNVLRLSSP